jgi:hypothetical protein
MTTRNTAFDRERYPEGDFASLPVRACASAVGYPNVELVFSSRARVRDSDDAAKLRPISRYPDGKFRSLADIMLARLATNGRAPGSILG